MARLRRSWRRSLPLELSLAALTVGAVAPRRSGPIAYRFDALEASWRDHRGVLLEHYLPTYIADHPGRRPWWWWTFELREPRPTPDPWTETTRQVQTARLRELDELTSAEESALIDDFGRVPD